jgi:hypothetical protein
LARWWSEAKPRIVNRWRAFWGLEPAAIAPAPLPPAKPEPSVSANVAVRLIQIHVCIIYLVAGLAKLLGKAWWEGTAVWGTLANFEFAPMQYEAYNWVLRMFGKNRFAFELFLTVSAYFTLVFEIGYAFLIWRPSLRWVILGMAIILHGFIGLFMGLKTFSLMMLVMNMAFLKPSEVRWALSWFASKTGPPAESRAPKTPEPDVLPAERSAAFRSTMKEPATATTEAIKRKKSG